MSLVGFLVGLLDLTVLAAFGCFLFRDKSGALDDGAQAIEDAWLSLTADLRAKNRFLPKAAAVVGWLFGVPIAAEIDAMLAGMVLALGVPFLLMYRAMGMLPMLASLVANAGDLFNDVKPDAEHFALPMQIYGAKADDVSSWSNAVSIKRRSVLVLGTTGAGKSTTLEHFVEQMQLGPDVPVISFDMKQDYRELLEERGIPTVRISVDDTEHKWNLFAEVESERDIDEIARGIFPDGDDGDQFFTTGGRQLFAATAKYVYREMDDPTNADLKRYWESTDAKGMYDDLTEHDDLTSAASAIDPDAGRQSAGVYATAQQTVSDVLVGDFGREGEFSVREYMENPDGRVLLLDYPNRQAKTVAPIFRFLIDESIKHGMADPSREAFYLLDEIEHLDATIKRLDQLVNVGRGNQCRTMLSLQSVAQLYDTYSKERGQAILSGMTTAVILRTGDAESTEWAKERIGTHWREYTHRQSTAQLPYIGSINTGTETKLEEEHDFTSGDFGRFEPGEAVVSRASKDWVFGRVKMLETPQQQQQPAGPAGREREYRFGVDENGDVVDNTNGEVVTGR